MHYEESKAESKKKAINRCRHIFSFPRTFFLIQVLLVQTFDKKEQTFH